MGFYGPLGVPVMKTELMIFVVSCMYDRTSQKAQFVVFGELRSGKLHSKAMLACNHLLFSSQMVLRASDWMYPNLWAKFFLNKI